MMFAKITVTDPKALPRVRDKCQLQRLADAAEANDFLPTRVFERGECSFRDLFKGIVSTYESNIAYTLRFMIDTKVSQYTPPRE